ncbi:MAG: M3 family metallopeptidase [Flavobacteriales bacterium]|nr:M3 family metallopeptidase [Flavobacteriales bacterium]
MNKKTLLFAVVSSLTLSLTAQNMDMGKKEAKPQEIINPFYGDYSTPYRTVAFDKITLEDYMPAVKKGIEIARAEVDAIVKNPATPTFENTIVAMERTGEMLGRATSVFYNLNSAETSPQMQKLAEEISPLLSEYSSDMLFNKALFDRIDYVYQNQDKENLTVEQKQVLKDTWKGYAEGGAKLSPEGQDSLRQISMKLSQLSLKFQSNVLKETNAFRMNITDEKKLEGLPKSAMDAAREEAQSAGEKGWTFTLKAPSYSAISKYAKDRSLRQKMYMAYNSRCVKGGQTDNRAVVEEIVSLRTQLAKLLGYQSYAHMAQEDRMAKKPATVNAFLAELLEKALPAAKRDVQMLADYAKKHDGLKKIEAWDHSYYANLLKEEQYSFNDEVLKPYFKLENVIQGVFYVANKLYGLTFTEVYDIPKYHPDVHTFVVRDAQGKFKAIFYGDYFPRDGKRDGAWMNSIKDQNKVFGDNQAPHIVNVCNFSKPTADTPSLLTFYEVTTLFHEFGHALHGMLSDVTYSSVSGTSVPRDFVELPSQVMENWAKQPEVLKVFAKHYLTGEVIPEKYIDALMRSINYMEGYATVRQLSFGMLDMAWYDGRADAYLKNKKHDFVKYERDAMKATQLYPYVDGTCMSVSFSHIFAGGYSAGYYSYKWSEMLDADAFEYFKENGLFSREAGKHFEKEILSKGGSVPADQLYINFRGRAATPDAMLRRAGLIK